MTITDPERIAADGAAITLEDGRVVRVRFGFAALRRLEAAYGGIVQMQKALEALDSRALDQPYLDVFMTVLEAGLAHEQLNSAELDALLHPSKLDDYRDAIVAAMTEAFPEPQPGEAPGEAVPKPSLGPSGTTSPPADTDAPTATSGP